MYSRGQNMIIQNNSNKMTKDKTSSKEVAHAVGRRKEAVATVKLTNGSEGILVNQKPFSTYFPGKAFEIKLKSPFTVCNVDKYSAIIRVSGGGIGGQLDASVLGIARALSTLKKEFRPLLKSAGLLTRDPRERQRRMIGMGGKSRRQKQSPKR